MAELLRAAVPSAAPSAVGARQVRLVLSPARQLPAPAGCQADAGEKVLDARWPNSSRSFRRPQAGGDAELVLLATWVDCGEGSIVWRPAPGAEPRGQGDAALRAAVADGTDGGREVQCILNSASLSFPWTREPGGCYRFGAPYLHAVSAVGDPR
jgi:hypothetical protein